LAEQLPHPLQLFYLTPSNVGTIPPYEEAADVLTKQHLGNEHLVEGETSQFHSQDGKGRALFGYTSPVQSRIEVRSEDGIVRGSYSYLDAWGKAVKVKFALSPTSDQFPKTSNSS
jgi:hypothetical protein